jgi:membrane-associated PAP2 superfamily phosphatase
MTPFFKRDLAWLAAGLLLMTLWDRSDLDLVLMRALGSAKGFAWKSHWFTADFLHGGGRWLSTLIFVCLVANMCCPLPRSQPWLSRPTALWCLLTTGLCLLLIPAIKHLSLTSCPWSLAEFGGSARWVSHWSLGVRDGGPGHCFPSGHASGAFAFLSVWFALRGLHLRAARRYLLGLLLVGMVFGAAQTLRGAHYPSHTVWTAWLCAAVTTLSWHLSQRYLSSPGGYKP